MALYEPAAKESKREGNSRGGKSNKSTANLQSTSRPKVDATAKAAEQLNVSPRSVAHAATVLKHGSKELQRMVDAATEIKLRAERRAGELLGSLGLKAGRKNADGRSVLADSGISHKQSSRWQAIAASPVDDRRERREDTRVKTREVLNNVATREF